jgi:hypothetical protein
LAILKPNSAINLVVSCSEILQTVDADHKLAKPTDGRHGPIFANVKMLISVVVGMPYARTLIAAYIFWCALKPSKLAAFPLRLK